MTTHIVIRGNTLAEIYESIHAVHVAQYKGATEENEWLREKLKFAEQADKFVTREKFEDIVAQRNDLQAKYTACARVRDEAASALKVALREVQELQQRLDEVDPGPNEMNKTLFNVLDIEKAEKRGYADGYEKGRREQMAEHATEQLHRRTSLSEMLKAHKVELKLGSVGTMPFIFTPRMVCHWEDFKKQAPEAARMIGDMHPNTVGIAGVSALTGRYTFYADALVVSWVVVSTRVAEEPKTD